MNQSTHRSPVYARGGIVAASQPLAVSAGIEILTKGGSAGDAAIATSAVLAVVEPGASHLGGDAFVISHNSARKKNLAFNNNDESIILFAKQIYIHPSIVKGRIRFTLNDFRSFTSINNDIH